MHEKEVCRIRLRSYLLRDTGSHRHSRDTGRSDQRIDPPVRHIFQKLAQPAPSGCTEYESDETQDDDLQRVSASW